MISFSKILFLSFVISALAVPLPVNADVSSEGTEVSEPISLDDATIKDQKIKIIRASEPIAEILDPYHRGIDVIGQIANRDYNKLLAKASQLNYHHAPLEDYQSIPMNISQSKQMSPNGNYNIWDNVRNFIHLNSKQNLRVVSPSAAVQGPYTGQIRFFPVVSKYSINKNPSSSSSDQSINTSGRQTLNNLLNNGSSNNQHRHDENRFARQTVENHQAFVPPEVIERIVSVFTNYDNVEGTTANSKLSDESSESDENQSGLTMTTSAIEELQTMTTVPIELDGSSGSTTFETTTEIPTTKSNEEEIILSTTQPELLDKNAEIDEAVAFNIDGGDISSTQETATQFPKINKDNFYVIYGKPTLTKKDNSLLINANIGMAVALSESNIDDVNITNVV